MARIPTFLRNFIPEPIKERLRLIRYKLQKRKYIAATKGLEFDFQHLFYIDPAIITEYLVFDPSNLDKTKHKGSVRDGDWDLNRKPFSSLDSYQAIKLCLTEGGDWQKTDFYQRAVNEIQSGTEKWGCRTEEDYKMRLQDLKRLYDDINENGFQTQVDRNLQHLEYDEISVCIDRNGEFLFHDGRHRLIISKLLGIKEIPVQVTLCHPDWYDFCREVKSDLQNRGGKLYAPLMHPLLSDLPSLHTHERFELMSENLPKDASTVLDIGAHWGYFCQRFESIGYKCTAIEIDQRTAYFMRKLRDAAGQTFDIFEGSVFSFKKKKFDIVLGLYIFHHFLKEKALFEAFTAFLQELKIQAMFLSCHDPAEEQMKGAYKNFNPDEFADFIMTHTGLSKKKMLGSFDDGRQLYLLSEQTS